MDKRKMMPDSKKSEKENKKLVMLTGTRYTIESKRFWMLLKRILKKVVKNG